MGKSNPVNSYPIYVHVSFVNTLKTNRKVQHLLSLSLASTYQVAAHCPSVITWLPWRSVHSGGESEYSYNTEYRHTNTNTATRIPGFVYWIYPSPLAERHCAHENLFSNYTASLVPENSQRSPFTSTPPASTARARWSCSHHGGQRTMKGQSTQLQHVKKDLGAQEPEPWTI